MTATPSVREMIDRLVATPSVSSVQPHQDRANLPVVALIAQWASDTGFSTDIVRVPDREGKVNLLGRLGPEGQPGGLVLAGHTDTVPCDEALWSSDPYRVEERHGRLFGLGTSDMKSFFALALEATARVRASGARLRRPLILLGTADEESTMSGARALSAPPGRFAVIGEPTGGKPVRLHKGIGMFGIELRGRSGHSSNPAYGASALEGMADLLSELRAWRREMQATHRNDAFEVPVPTLNLGAIHGGDNPNRICGQCELWIDVRSVPGQDLAAIRAELDRRISRALEGHPALRAGVTTKFDGVEAFQTPETSEIVRAAEELTGHPAGGVAFATEGPFLNALGCETVVLGPGEISVAHQPDEHLAMDRVEPAIGILERLIGRFCVE